MHPDPLFVEFQVALAGRYSIDRELGRGGMGVVYLAHEVHLDRPVAIKLLPPDRARNPALRERFVREARMAAKLSHPNIIPIHAVDEAAGFVFYVMAYVNGETLAERVRNRGPLSSGEAARVLRDVAWALAHAHAQGLVHRDIKPDNILLETGTGRVLVADFGIAAVTTDAPDGAATGTPEFMSPEQALGRDVDGRSDIYSLGATAFYAVTGRLLFAGATPTEIVARHVTEAAPPIASIGTPVSRRIAGIVDHCLAKEPELRPQSAEAVAEQLGLALDQRKEMPLALRVFAKAGGRLNGAGTVVFPFIVLGATVWVAGTFGTGAAYVTFGVLGLMAPFAYLVNAARRLLKRGFAHEDLEPAFNAELDQIREERASQYGRFLSRFEQPLRRLARISGVTFLATGGWIVLAGARLIPSYLFPPVSLDYVFALSALGTSVCSVGYLAALQSHEDADGRIWKGFWTGRLGRFVFSVAKRFVRPGSRGGAMTHRPTELALGLAAESLYETLPREARESLRALPALLRRLQDDARTLRAQFNELQDALADASEAGLSPAYAGVRESRDDVHARLTQVVSALETIRLNLLRLHAGSATVEGLTTHLDIAADVSAEVQRLLAAREEIERHLEFPREIASTPA
jgi:eukaryotic-like serine/threonine-protein kinase